MKIVRSVDSRALFLTFDDGPSEETRKVLSVLRSENVLATFFVVAKRAEDFSSVLEDVMRDGHAIGHHSFDHTYGVFFSSRSKLKKWIEDGEALLKKIGVSVSVGFRPPNGIVTPPLKRVLQDKREPLILWNVRFYDAVIPWTRKRALASLSRTKAGSIILLHDAQRPARIDEFCLILRDYIREAKARGFTFDRLTSDLVQKQSFS